MAKYLNEECTLFMWNKIKGLVGNKVDKELKTGSTDQYKVLSDNNLTDELVTKIRSAGSGTFTGYYGDLLEIPTEFNPASHQHTAADVTDLETLVNSKIEAVVGAAPEALDTLQELSAALNDDENFGASVIEQLALKANVADIGQISNSSIDAICV